MLKIFRISVGDKLSRCGGIGPGFDLVRFALSSLIFFGHCFWIAGSRSVELHSDLSTASPHSHSVPVIWAGQSNFRQMLVPMFFALSGFLVTGSAFRTNSLRVFATFRILRIIPALSTEVALSALLLGPICTTVALRIYFSDHTFFEYFGNIIGRVRMLLPGVFIENPATRAVNANLWTLPPEFYCYFIIATLLAARLLARRFAFSMIFAIATFFIIAFGFFTLPIDRSAEGLPPVSLIVYYFFCGCMFFHWRDVIPYHAGIFVACTATAYILYQNDFVFLAPFFVTYMVIFAGMTAFPRIRLIQDGDYSYGIYLYGFPIAQAIIALAPQLRGHAWYLLFIAAPLTLGFAVFSWHVIEKPMLSLKRFFASKTSSVANSPQP
jgi:peptidoglycan/LPS O-acetylase OafA/YrhL